MHDLKSLLIEDAITRHRGEAADPARDFRQLLPDDQQDLLTFLSS
jgi:CxxC motif-containing protein (DUF1111 family)